MEIMKEKMNKSLNSLDKEYGSIRAGRASAAVLDKIAVDYYGVPTPIGQMAAISSPDARTLLIQPWDMSTLKEIEKAIQASDLGINPNNDGKSIRLIFPQLTEERRKEICKDIKKYAEDCKIAIRSIRRDAIERYKTMKKNGEITEDDLKNYEKKIQNETDKFCKETDTLAEKKEKEIMSI